MAHCRRRCVLEASSDDPHSIILYCVKALQMRVCQSQKAKTILYYCILWLIPLATTALIASRPFLALGCITLKASVDQTREQGIAANAHD